MENELIICPACGIEVSSDKNFCTSCGYSFNKMKEAQKVLDNDPELVVLNNKYASARITKRVWTITLVVSIFITYMWLEYNWFENYFTFISTLAILCIPASIIALIITSIKVSTTRKKIESGLEEKVGNYHLDLDEN